MLLDQYKANNLFFNTNFCEKTSQGEFMGYRGDLVLVDGGLDDKGHPNPPEQTLRGGVVLADEKIHMLVGSLDQIDMLPIFLQKYASDFAADAKVMLFVVNSKERAQFMMGDIAIAIIPLVQGVCWNEAIDELALEKGDFKGQAPADKIYTVYQEMKTYRAKGAVKTLDDLLVATTNIKREAWGAV